MQLVGIDVGRDHVKAVSLSKLVKRVFVDNNFDPHFDPPQITRVLYIYLS